MCPCHVDRGEASVWCGQKGIQALFFFYINAGVQRFTKWIFDTIKFAILWKGGGGTYSYMLKDLGPNISFRFEPFWKSTSNQHNFLILFFHRYTIKIICKSKRRKNSIKDQKCILDIYSAEKTDRKICINPRLFSILKNGGGGWHEPSAFALGHENPLRSSVRAMQFLYRLMMFAL